MSGEAGSNTAVWVAPIRTPSQHWSDAKADGSGNFSVEVDLGRQSSVPRFLLLGAKHPESIESYELIDLSSFDPHQVVELYLRKSAHSLDEPELDEVKEWLTQRLGGKLDCQPQEVAACRTLAVVLEEYTKGPADSLGLLDRVMPIAEESGLPEAQLLAALMLMRTGAWMSAEQMLARAGQSEALPVERSFLQGVLWNFLRRPEEAIPALEHAVRLAHEDALGELELGRAYVLDEDWLNARNSLDVAMAHHAPPDQVHYLRIQTLLALGETEGAYFETKTLTKSLEGHPLPPEVNGLVAEVLGRLGESYNVLTYAVSALVQRIPALRSLDPNGSPPPEGLEPLVRKVGTNVESFFKNLTETGAEETVRQTRMSGNQQTGEERVTKNYYIIEKASANGHAMFREYRRPIRRDSSPLIRQEESLMITSNFVSSLSIFLPELRKGIGFRFLGRQELAGRLTYVIAFAQRPAISPPLTSFQTAQGISKAHQQGIAWIADGQYQVVRLHTDLLYPLPDLQLKLLSADIDYRPRRVGDSPQVFWLPVGVTVRVDWAGKQFRNQHALSNYGLFKVTTHEKRR